MKIYTGNFGKLSKLKEDIVPIDITLRTPAYYKGLSFKELAPSSSLLHDYKLLNINDRTYTTKFKNMLKSLDPEKAYKILEYMSNGKDIVLVCYCAEYKFCHRHLVAEWLSKKLEIEIFELGTDISVRKQGKLIKRKSCENRDNKTNSKNIIP